MGRSLNAGRLHRHDQAAGLRALFGPSEARLVPLVANPHLRSHPILLERLCSALSEHGARLLVIDAADTSPEPHELCEVDLGACIERLGPRVHYLAARGLPRRHVDTRGSAQGWLAAVEAAAAPVDLVLLHATARDMTRLIGARDARPVLMCGVDHASLTDAYASIKLLAQRLALRSFDLLVSEDGRPQRAAAAATRLADTADVFLGAVQRSHAAVDCRQPAQASLPQALRQLAHDQRTRAPHATDPAPGPLVQAALSGADQPPRIPF
ncbi:flagellar biosynthesis protein [Ideonella alba]|uniref:Flagellar biosynthesis protein n=1 Tax=Ideonella alba TaxID=2824118 RepID=A0A941BK48_9BURK|nr:flagellar biosynthesis protein [Ideonella alba]MBQ0929764.1 flagellar biosynthesis protein [Ideonella alba]